MHYAFLICRVLLHQRRRPNCVSSIIKQHHNSKKRAASSTKKQKRTPFSQSIKKASSPSSHLSFCYLVTQLKQKIKSYFSQNDTGFINHYIHTFSNTDFAFLTYFASSKICRKPSSHCLRSLYGRSLKIVIHVPKWGL